MAMPGPQADLEDLKAALLARFPELRGATFTVLSMGWDSEAVDVDDRLIFKFPRHAAAEAALRREAALLAIARPRLTMPIPDLVLFEGPPLFSRHAKLRGEHLVTAQYDRLPDAAKQQLAADMALFYAEIHRLDGEAMAAAGAKTINPCLEPGRVDFGNAVQWLPPGLLPRAAATIAAWNALGADPYGRSYGFFDGHGWNMAFDHRAQHLNGIYDFADSGFGPLHQEFVHTGFISADLTARVIDAYEPIAGRQLDRRRIDLLTGVLRLVELGVAEDADEAGQMVERFRLWAEGQRLAGLSW